MLALGFGDDVLGREEQRLLLGAPTSWDFLLYILIVCSLRLVALVWLQPAWVGLLHLSALGGQPWPAKSERETRATSLRASNAPTVRYDRVGDSPAGLLHDKLGRAKQLEGEIWILFRSGTSSPSCFRAK